MEDFAPQFDTTEVDPKAKCQAPPHHIYDGFRVRSDTFGAVSYFND
jgi:hypothetical protein